MSVDQFLLSGSDTDLNYPNIRPTLDLNFARTKTLDPRITFTRASGGSYVGADGLIKYAGVNEPRFDHDPATGESLGLLIEESRTNIVTNSEDIDFYDNPSLYEINVSTDSTIAPDGSNNADSFLGTGVSGRPTLQYNTTLPSDTKLCCSVFVKSINGFDKVALETANYGGWADTGFVKFDLTKKEILGNTVQGGGIIEYPNGWFRIYLISTTNSNGTAGGFYVNLMNDTLSWSNHVVQTNEGVHLWGAQIEAGAFPTSYIPTSGSTATRALEYGYATNMDFYNQNEGSVLSEIKLLDLGTTVGKVIWSLNQVGGFGEGIYHVNENGANNIKYSVQNNGSQFSGDSFTPNNFIKSAIGLKENSMINYFNGSLVGIEDTSGTIPNNIGRLVIGNNAWGSSTPSNNLNPGNCHIKSFSYYPKRLTNAQLQTLTR